MRERAIYIYRYHFSGTVTFKHFASVTELNYKLGFIIYDVQGMKKYHRNLSRPYTSIFTNHKAPSNDGYFTYIFSEVTNN